METCTSSLVTLNHPVTRQPCEFVASLRGHVALRLACTVSPSVQWFKQSDVSPHLTDMVYTVEPDPRTMDNVIALTEILNTRNPERQAERDLYTYQLYCAIADEVEAAA
jgi:hypothetical protein